MLLVPIFNDLLRVGQLLPMQLYLSLIASQGARDFSRAFSLVYV
jgi:hypothetical protein